MDIATKFSIQSRGNRRDYFEGVRMTRVRKVTIAILLVVLSTALAGTFLTRGVMEYLPFLQAKRGNWTGAYVSHGIVDQRPWQTAATLAGMAQSAEEREFAREAERLADHEVGCLRHLWCDKSCPPFLRPNLDLGTEGPAYSFQRH